MPLPPLIKQAAAIPFRVRDGIVELCVITTMRQRRWSVPKGIIDPGQTSTDTALIESWEEAGLRGEVVGPPLGNYEYAKWGTTLTVEVHLMHVTETAAAWPEQRARDRRWVDATEAQSILADHPVAPFLADAIARAGESGPPSVP